MDDRITKTFAILEYLGVEVSEIEALREMPYEKAVLSLAALKEKVRRGYRKAILDFHPDRTGQDPECTQVFLAITAIKEQFDNLSLPAPPIEARPVEPFKVEPQHKVVVSPPIRGSSRSPGYRTATLKP